MSKSELIVLALAAVAVYMLVVAKPKTGVTSADGWIAPGNKGYVGQTDAERAFGRSLGEFAG